MKSTLRLGPVVHIIASSVIGVFFSLSTHTLCDDSVDPIPASGWEEVDGSEISRTISAIRDISKDNYSKLSTWNGTYDILHEQYLTHEQAQSILQGQLPIEHVAGVVQSFEHDVQFTYNITEDKGFRSKQTRLMKFRDPESSAEIPYHNLSAVDGRTILTSEHFITFDPAKKWPGFSMLSSIPEAHNKRTAFRYPESESLKKVDGDLLDPRRFYFSGNRPLWDELNLTLTSRASGEYSKLRDSRHPQTSLESVQNELGTWYKLTQTFEDSQSNLLFLTQVFCSTDRFNLCRRTFSKGSPDGIPFESASTVWKIVDDVAVPETVIEERRDRDSGKRLFFRKATLRYCEVNVGVEDELFTYVGLGMEDGDLVVDHIEGVALAIEGDSTRLLGRFNTQPKAARSGWFRSGLSFYLLLLNSLAFLGIFYLIIRRRMTSK